VLTVLQRVVVKTEYHTGEQFLVLVPFLQEAMLLVSVDVRVIVLGGAVCHEIGVTGVTAVIFHTEVSFVEFLPWQLADSEQGSVAMEVDLMVMV
jgi:hypothetical protein